MNIKIKEKIKEWLFSSEMLRIKQLEKQTNYNNYEQRNYDNLDNLYANKKL